MGFDPLAFGRRVAAARVWKGLKPKELARRLGRSSETVNAIERGDRKESPDKLLLEALARELGQSEEWLLNGTTPPWESEEARPGPDSQGIDQTLQELGALLERASQLHAEARRRVEGREPPRSAERRA